MAILRIEIRSKANAPEMWVLYENPRDCPGFYVLRKWINAGEEFRPTEESYKALSAEDVRANLPAGLMRLRPEPEDDPCIMEVWI